MRSSSPSTTGPLAAGLLGETLLVICSDHGEAFGDHGLYLHDASVYDTHLHVPLYVLITSTGLRASWTTSSARAISPGILQIGLPNGRAAGTILAPRVPVRASGRAGGALLLPPCARGRPRVPAESGGRDRRTDEDGDRSARGELRQTRSTPILGSATRGKGRSTRSPRRAGPAGSRTRARRHAGAPERVEGRSGIARVRRVSGGRARTIRIRTRKRPLPCAGGRGVPALASSTHTGAARERERSGDPPPRSTRADPADRPGVFFLDIA